MELYDEQLNLLIDRFVVFDRDGEEKLSGAGDTTLGLLQLRGPEGRATLGGPVQCRCLF